MRGGRGSRGARFDSTDTANFTASPEFSSAYWAEAISLLKNFLISTRHQRQSSADQSKTILEHAEALNTKIKGIQFDQQGRPIKDPTRYKEILDHILDLEKIFSTPNTRFMFNRIFKSAIQATKIYLNQIGVIKIVTSNKSPFNKPEEIIQLQDGHNKKLRQSEFDKNLHAKDPEAERKKDEAKQKKANKLKRSAERKSHFQRKHFEIYPFLDPEEETNHATDRREVLDALNHDEDLFAIFRENTKKIIYNFYYVLNNCEDFLKENYAIDSSLRRLYEHIKEIEKDLHDDQIIYLTELMWRLIIKACYPKHFINGVDGPNTLRLLKFPSIVNDMVLPELSKPIQDCIEAYQPTKPRFLRKSLSASNILDQEVKASTRRESLDDSHVNSSVRSPSQSLDEKHSASQLKQKPPKEKSWLRKNGPYILAFVIGASVFGIATVFTLGATGIIGAAVGVAAGFGAFSTIGSVIGASTAACYGLAAAAGVVAVSGANVIMPLVSRALGMAHTVGAEAGHMIGRCVPNVRLGSRRSDSSNKLINKRLNIHDVRTTVSVEDLNNAPTPRASSENNNNVAPKLDKEEKAVVKSPRKTF